MLLFLVSVGAADLEDAALTHALLQAAAAFPQLDAATLRTARSITGDVNVATVGHSGQASRPRRYTAENHSAMALFDGLPIDGQGEFAAHDAAVLLDRWQTLAGRLEGQFVALRIDFRADVVECLTDALGIAPLYMSRHKKGYLLSNSVEAIRAALRLTAPDPLGVSCFLSLGWAAGDRVLVGGVTALRGGHQYRMRTSGLSARPYLSPSTVAEEVRREKRVNTPELVGELVSLTSSATTSGLPVKSALTGGRDTRVLLALLEACGAQQVRYYTIGCDVDDDVRIARQIAAAGGLNYQVWPPSEVDATGDVLSLTKKFVSQSDGLSNLNQIGEYGDQMTPLDRVGLKVSGLGGEIGRAGVGAVRFGGTIPLVRRSTRLQTALMRRLRPSFQSLLRPEAMSLSTEYLRRFAAERRAEGWQTQDLSETFYVFDRVARWGSAGLRRTSAVDDHFSPFCSQAFIRYCFSQSPAERYLETSHYRILSALSPELRDMAYEKPWRKQQPRLATALASYELAKLLAERAATTARIRQRLGLRYAAAATPRGVAEGSIGWFERHIEAHRDLCLSLPQSPLWDWVDRDAVETALAAGPAARRGQIDGLLRVVTLFWYFHGRDAT